ncbi:MAG: hypothetical protein NZ750_01470 [Anaerolineae bacterium]|nr:hypothetical protein [Anaerolineae bacterium]MDW8173254.1 hypothetical protein [Anaerolineae bacterium]
MQRRGFFVLVLCTALTVGLASAQDSTPLPPLPTINIIVATDTPGPTSTPPAALIATQQATSTPLRAQTATPAVSDQPQRGIEIFLQGADIAPIIAQLSQLNVSWVRIVLNWRDVEVVRGTLNLSAIDAAIARLRAANYSILLTLTGAPDWARPSATPFVLSLPQYGPPDNLADFAIFASAIATRYKGQVAAYEVWTEPNLRRSWIDPQTTSRETARMSPARYIDLLSEAYRAIKAADPAAMVISGGLAPTGINDRRNSIDDEVFLEALFQQGLASVADAVGVQPNGFANPPAARCCVQSEGVLTHWESKKFYFLDMLDSYRTIIARANANLPMWIVRFGWGTSEGNTIVSPNMNENPFFTYNSPAEQAQYTAEGLNLLNGMADVKAVFIFNLNGCQVGQAEACFYSLIDSNNQARPIFSALTR